MMSRGFAATNDDIPSIRRQLVVMSLESYFKSLIERVESSDIGNNGTDQNGFFRPTRTLLLRHLNLLKDLHGKHGAKSMVRASWAFVAEELPPEWLIAEAEEKAALRKMLGP